MAKAGNQIYSVCQQCNTQCGIKGFRDSVAIDLFSAGRLNGFAFDVELFFIALKRGHSIKRHPVQLKTQGESTVSILRDSIRMLWELPQLIWHNLSGQYD